MGLPGPPAFPYFTVNPCSIVSDGVFSCQVSFPNLAALPDWLVQVLAWTIQVTAWALVQLGAVLLGSGQWVIDLIVTSLEDLLYGFFQAMQSVTAPLGPFALPAAAFGVGATILLLTVLVWFLVDVLVYGLDLAIDLA